MSRSQKNGQCEHKLHHHPEQLGGKVDVNIEQQGFYYYFLTNIWAMPLLHYNLIEISASMGTVLDNLAQYLRSLGYTVIDGL